MKDTLTNALNKIKMHQNANVSHSVFNEWWVWMSVIILVILFVLVIIIRRKASKRNENKDLVHKAKKEQVDFKNVIQSSFNAEGFYDQLKVKCHPDRFPVNENEELNKIADDLFQQITKNKNDLKELTRLKLEAEDKLNIKF